MWSNSSRCRIISIYLLRTWCLYTWSCLDNLITMRFSINCSTVICSPTVILMLSREKPLVKPMAPGSISYHICFQSTFICIFTFCIYTIKYQEYFYLIILSLLDLTFASGCCRCQNRRISGRGSRSVRLRLMVTGSKGHNVYPGSGPLDGGKTLLPAWLILMIWVVQE